MKTTLVLLLLPTAAGAFYLSRLCVIHAQSIESLNVTPFVMTTTDYVIEDGKEVDTASNKTERRKDGSRALIATRLRAPELGKAYKRVEMASGLEAMVIDYLQAKSSGQMTPQQLASKKLQLTSPPANCVREKETLIDEETLFGYRVNRVVTDASSSSPKTRFIIWRLPTFSCEVAQMEFQQLTSSGAWQTTAGKRLNSITAADPPDTDFTNWKSYEEMKPSDLKRLVAKDNGVTPAQCPKCYQDDPVADKNYLNARR